MSQPSKACFERIARLQSALSKLEGYFIEQPLDLLYYTGMHMSRGHLYILRETSRLFVDGRYLTAAKEGGVLPVEELTCEKEVRFLKGCRLLGFDGSAATYDTVQALRRRARKAQAKLRSRPEILRKIRMVKGADELCKMEKSAQLAHDAYRYIRKRLVIGVTERELCRQLEIYCLEQGAEAMAFAPIIAFGKNSALPHHRPGKTQLGKNTIVLFDLGVVVDGYCSDMTRVDFVGKVDPTLDHLYQVNLKAQQMALSHCKPGTRLKELDLAARSVMKSAGLEHLFTHNLGHGVGLDIHEGPSIRFDGPERNTRLEEGMVITIEPGLYLPGKGGVRYEDTIALTSKGYKNLTSR